MRVRWRTLYRAGVLSGLTPDDLDVIADLGITTVIDLRTAMEAENRGSFPGLDGVALHHLPLSATLPGTEQAPSWNDALFVSDRYRNMLKDGSDAAAAVVRLISERANRPAVFHCSIGKDRTGVMSAVILGFLGVAKDTIVDDYVLSTEAMQVVLAGLKEEFADQDDIVQLFASVVLSVKPDAMAGFLQSIDDDYGSFEGLADFVGVSDEVELLRSELLEDA